MFMLGVHSRRHGDSFGSYFLRYIVYLNRFFVLHVMFHPLLFL